MSKPTKLQAAMAVMAAVTSGQLDDASEADFKALLDGAAAGQSLSKALDRALSAARSRTWEQVADAALAAAADGAPRSARSRLRTAVASAAAVRRLELRLSGDSDIAPTGTSAETVADAETDTAAASSGAVVLHAQIDTAADAVLHTQNDTEEVSQ